MSDLSSEQRWQAWQQLALFPAVCQEARYTSAVLQAIIDADAEGQWQRLEAARQQAELEQADELKRGAS